MSTTTVAPVDTHAVIAPEGISESYVAHTLRTTKELPPFRWSIWYKEINWIGFTVLVLPPFFAVYGLFTTTLTWKTFAFAYWYHIFTGLGITAGYHRLWAHRSYNASLPLQYFLAILGAAAVEGPIKWWARGHRAHHRYTDTDLDPYSAHKGLLYSHIGWMVMKPRRRPGTADVSDLSTNQVVKWQYKYYGPLVLFFSIIFPILVCGLGWGDWRGGVVYAFLCRLVVVHHKTFFVNSLAHYLGDTPFDDKHTPRDHIFTAFMTLGEGYHNFHHQFPMDYRNAIKFYQYDPTKWFIKACSFVGLASHLKTFSDNEVGMGQYTMELKKLRKKQDNLKWPKGSQDLPIVPWASFTEQAEKRALIVVAGFIHDVSGFLDEHPGGRSYLLRYVGKDATAAFFGGVYEHSNAGHNLLASKRVGVLQNGVAHGSEEKMSLIPPSQRLHIYKRDEVSLQTPRTESNVGAPLFLASHVTSTDRTGVPKEVQFSKDEGYATGIGSGESVGSDEEELKSAS